MQQRVSSSTTAPSGYPAEVIVATNSIRLEEESQTAGDVAVTHKVSGGTLGNGGVEVTLKKKAKLTGSLRADTIEIEDDGVITGNASFNQLDNSGSIGGTKTGSLTLPLVISVPDIPDVSVGSSDLKLDESEVLTLAPGNYRELYIEKSATLKMTGGTYNFRSVELKEAGRLVCVTECDVRVQGDFKSEKDTFIGPASGSGRCSGDLRITILGLDEDGSGDFGDELLDQHAELGSFSTVLARFFVPNGLLHLTEGMQAKGTFVAGNIIVDKFVVVSKGVGSADDSNPCTADACDAAGNLVNPPVSSGTACLDADVCNGSEICDGAGTCAAGTPLVVDDENACTSDACDAVTGVSHEAEAAGVACADDDVCNGAETCDGASVCVAGDPLDSDDGNVCTADSCDAVEGVQNLPVSAGTACLDGDVCNGAEACDGAGSCADFGWVE